MLKLTKGKVTASPELKRRVDLFRKFWMERNGDVIIQTNVEDQKLGIDVYALSNLEVNIIERKWGQGAKAIGGEVRLKDLQKAILAQETRLHRYPDPEDPVVQQAFKEGVFSTFERHSPSGHTQREKLHRRHRMATQARRPRKYSLRQRLQTYSRAYTMKWASEAKIDALSSRWRRRRNRHEPPYNDGLRMSIPTLYLQAIVMRCAQILRKKANTSQT